MNLVRIAISLVVVGAALAVIMAAAWRLQQRSGNSGWVDTIWSFGVGTVAVVAALVPFAGGQVWRQALVALLVAAWSLRLGGHIALRTRGAHDDPRYRQMAQAWGAAAPRRMFWFLQAQAAAGVPLVLAVMLAAHHPEPGLRAQDLLGALVLASAIIGEAVADHQLRRFKANPLHRGAVCDAGLWRWSRHPNYFFDWCGWLAYPLIAVDLGGAHPYGWAALAAPACMYWLLVHVSGIPPLEAHMERSRGEAFRAYQRRTPAFFPFRGGREQG